MSGRNPTVSFAPDCSTSCHHFFFAITMPIFLGVSAKVAITTGALIGGVVAVLANQERVLEITARVLQKGADALNKRAAEKRLGVYAHKETHDESGAFYEQDEHAAGDDLHSDVTTPSGTDVELSDSELELSDSEAEPFDTEVEFSDAEDTSGVRIARNSSGTRHRGQNELIADEVD